MQNGPILHSLSCCRNFRIFETFICANESYSTTQESLIISNSIFPETHLLFFYPITSEREEM